jgi:gluconolactonase
MQNDVVMDGGAFASSGSPAHRKQQNARRHAGGASTAAA